MDGAKRRWWTARKVALTGLLVLFGSSFAAVLMVRATARLEPIPAMPFFAGDRPLVIAHRGASGHLREHTLESYELAVEQGADVLELDVRLSRDGVPVVIHDSTLERTFGVSGAVSDMTLAELRAAGGGEPPTLGEVMARFPDVRLNIELKSGERALGEAVAALLFVHDRARDVLVASFHGRALRRFRAFTRGEVATSASFGEVLRFYLGYRLGIPSRVGYQSLQVPVGLRWLPDLASSDFLAFAHRHGLAVHYWTVDDPETMRRLYRLGADGVMTNYPDRAWEARARAGE